MNETLLDRVRGAYHGIFGIPDYDAYLRHRRERHPGEPVLPRDDFARDWIERRYRSMKGRCC
jgi:uncharacterized short protein YbdD (DUF466 family)